MNKLSKLTALLLAIVLALGVPMQVMAESIDTETKYEAEVSRLLELLYNNMMDGEEYQELLDMTETMGRQDIVNFLERMIAEGVDDDMAEYDAHIAELFEEYMKTRVIPFTYAYTNVGPFLNYGTPAVEEAATFALLSRAAVTESASNSTTGLNTTKSVTWDQKTSKGTITLEAFSTGATTITQSVTMPPLDIVLVLDQSTSMVRYKMPSGYEKIDGNPSTNNAYYVLDEVNSVWIEVSWCSRCNAWTDGCNHYSYWGQQIVVGKPYDPEDTPFYEATSEVTREAALIPAVQTFVDMVNEKAEGDPTTTEDNVHHRIAFVGYSSEARVYTGVGQLANDNTKAFISLNTAAGQQTAYNIVHAANPPVSNYADTQTTSIWHNSSGTRTDLALAEALNILEVNDVPLATDDKNGNGTIEKGEERTRIVILFTDGEPFLNNSSDQAAAAALPYSYDIKNSENATLYSIGVLDGAAPNKDIPTSSSFDINKFLHFVSSNYPLADSMSDNFAKNNAGYYLAATNATELESIFTQIADNIQTGGSSTTLTEETVVKDVLTNTFQLPETATGGKTNVRVYIADIQDAKTNPFTFKDRVLVYGNDGTNNATNSAYAPTIDGNAISVKGFNFSENWCGTITDEKGNITTRAEGKKLIIEIDFEPVDGFLGGNDVETNVKDQSGIFKDQESANKNDPVIQLPDPPNVDVNIVEVEIVGKDQHIYLSNYADLDALLKSFSTIYRIITIKDGIVQKSDEYEVDGILNHYADVEFVLRDKDGYVVAGYKILAKQASGTWYQYATNADLTTDASNLFTDTYEVDKVRVLYQLTEDTEYTISYTVSPSTTKEDGVTATTDTLTSTVYVYYPTVTFKDTTHNYGYETISEEDAEYYNVHNFQPALTTWSHTYDGGITVTFTTDNAGSVTNATVTGAGVSNVTWTPGTDRVDFTYTVDEKSTPAYIDMWWDGVPLLGFQYDPSTTDAWLTGGKVTGIECVPVNVTAVQATSSVMYDDDGLLSPLVMNLEVTNDITSYRIEQGCECNYDAPSDKETDVADEEVYEFVVHIKNAFSELKIIKEGLSVGESAIFTVSGKVPNGTAAGADQTWTIVLTKTSTTTDPSAIITGLLVGSTATVEEMGNWSWRYNETKYDPPSKSVTVLPKTQSTATITIENNNRSDQWLSDESAVKNDFSKDTE